MFHSLNGWCFTTDHQVSRTEVIGDPDQSPGLTLLDQILKNLFIQKQNTGHRRRSLLRSHLHNLTTKPDQLQAGCEVDGTSKGQSGVFTKAKTRTGDAGAFCLGMALPQFFQRRKACNEKRGLADIGGIDLFGRPLTAKPKEVKAEDFGRLVK